VHKRRKKETTKEQSFKEKHSDEQKSKRTLIIHPFLFAIFPLVFLLSYNIDFISPSEILFPSLIILAITFTLWILLGFIFKNRKKSAFIVSLGVILFSFYGHVYILLDGDVYDDKFVPHELLLSIFLIFFIIGTFYFIKTKRELDKVTVIANTIAIVLVAISLVNIGINIDVDTFEKSDTIIETTNNLQQFPDIYYIILDEYAHSDLLQKYLNFDNSEFLNFLSEEGFHNSPITYSNYARTTVSMPSILNAEYVHLNLEQYGVSTLTPNLVTYLTFENKVMAYLKLKGYTIYTHNSGHWPTTQFSNSDYHLCDDVNNLNSGLVPLYMRTTMLNPIHVQFFAGDYRERILCIFSELSDIPNKNDDGPKFIFAHIMLPHQPYVFGENGEPIQSKAINKLNWDWSQERYLGQLKFANQKLQEIIPKLLESDNEPIIIIQSDHGMRHGLDDWDNPTKDFLEKRHGSIKSYYFPGGVKNLLFENTTAVNTFRIIFNQYIDPNIELLPDKIFLSKEKFPPFFTDVTEILFN
jgi:hypothetical protein